MSGGVLFLSILSLSVLVGLYVLAGVAIGWGPSLSLTREAWDGVLDTPDDAQAIYLLALCLILALLCLCAWAVLWPAWIVLRIAVRVGVLRREAREKAQADALLSGFKQ